MRLRILQWVRRSARPGALLLVAAMALAAPGRPVSAQDATGTANPISGVGLFPASLGVTDALRGQRYDTGTVLVNSAGDDRTFSITVEGDIAGWFTFATQSEPETLVTEVVVPAGGELPIWVYVNVPEDTPNQAYASRISYSAQPDPGATSGVVLTVVQPVQVSVTGEQILDVSLGAIFVLDIEVGQPLRVLSRIANRSNIAVAPSITLDIQTSAGVPIADNLQNRLEQLRAGEERELEAYSWDSSGQQPGDYVLHYSLTAQGEEFASGDLPFTLSPFGTLERSGEIVSITFDDSQSVGQVGRADILFKNTGASDVRARFVGEMYLDDDLLEPLESRDELLAKPGNEITLNVFFDIEQDGTYELRGHVNFEGAQTEEASASFTTPGASGGGSVPPVALAALAVLALGLLAVGGAMWRRRMA